MLYNMNCCVSIFNFIRYFVFFTRIHSKIIEKEEKESRQNPRDVQPQNILVIFNVIPIKITYSPSSILILFSIYIDISGECTIYCNSWVFFNFRMSFILSNLSKIFSSTCFLLLLLQNFSANHRTFISQNHNHWNLFDV